MEVALIPPISLVEETSRTNMQLMLPQLCFNKDYAGVYEALCDSDSQYVIMDNGAAENNQLDNKQLVEHALWYSPNELAIPDVIGEAKLTLERAKEFLNEYGVTLHEGGIKLGFVAQGLDLIEAQYTVDWIADNYGWLVDTIYIPRHLVSKENPFIRSELAVRINHTHGDRFNIHLFGVSSFWPSEVNHCKQYPFIRSIDTSLPYSYAYYGKLLKAGPQQPVSRPDDYFMASMTRFGGYSVNVERFLKWAT